MGPIKFCSVGVRVFATFLQCDRDRHNLIKDSQYTRSYSRVVTNERYQALNFAGIHRLLEMHRVLDIYILNQQLQYSAIQTHAHCVFDATWTMQTFDVSVNILNDKLLCSTFSVENGSHVKKDRVEEPSCCETQQKQSSQWQMCHQEVSRCLVCGHHTSHSIHI